MIQNGASFYVCCLTMFLSSLKSLLGIPVILVLWFIWPVHLYFFSMLAETCLSCCPIQLLWLPLSAGWTSLGSCLPRQTKGNASQEVRDEENSSTTVLIQETTVLILRSSHTKPIHYKWSKNYSCINIHETSGDSLSLMLKWQQTNTKVNLGRWCLNTETGIGKKLQIRNKV